MDITGIKSTNTSVYDTKKTNNKTDTENTQEKTQNLGTDTFVKSTESNTEASTYKPVKKKLSTEEVAALKEDQANAKADLIQRFIADTINNQSKLLGKSRENEVPGMSRETTDLLTKAFGSIEKAYPPLATTPDDAQQAISEGGAYSVNAVADRIITLAKYIAGDNPDKLQQMRDAVEKGFSEAGLAFKSATNSGLPQICEDTHTEIMRRFDELQGKTNNANEQTEPNNK